MWTLWAVALLSPALMGIPCPSGHPRVGGELLPHIFESQQMPSRRFLGTSCLILTTSW